MIHTSGQSATSPGVDALDLYLLPASQDVVCPVSTRDLDAEIAELMAWLRRRGYTPIGPTMLGWNEWAVRQLRQSIAPVFAPHSEPPYSVVERPELMVAELPITMARGAFNLAGVYDQVQEYGLDPLGAPYIPLGETANAVEHDATLGFVPVVPGGTSSLVPLRSWFTTKIGWLPRGPVYGVLASSRLAVEQTALILLRTLIGLVLLGIVLLPYLAICGWSSGLTHSGPMQDIVLASLLPSLIICVLLELFIGGIMLWMRLRAVRLWNIFWGRTPTPPVLTTLFTAEEM